MERLKRKREARRGVGHGEGGRAATVARDSGGGSCGGGRAGRREGDSGGVRGSCFVWVSGWWFRISTWTFLRSSKANFLLSVFFLLYLFTSGFVLLYVFFCLLLLFIVCFLRTDVLFTVCLFVFIDLVIVNFRCYLVHIY